MAGHKVLTCFLQFLRLIGIEGEERICSVAVLSARKLPHWRKPPFVWISNAFTRVCEQRHVPYRVARGSRLDIQNINLLATLLVHAQYQGYWSHLGMQFQEEMEALLERHVLNGLVDAPWVRTDDPESDDDDGFFAALQELVAYAFEESVRIKKKGRLFPGWHEKPVRSSRGILQEVQSLLQKYRNELVRQSRLLDQGGRA